jgi:hypothetical protein
MRPRPDRGVDVNLKAPLFASALGAKTSLGVPYGLLISRDWIDGIRYQRGPPQTANARNFVPKCDLMR